MSERKGILRLRGAAWKDTLGRWMAGSPATASLGDDAVRERRAAPSRLQPESSPATAQYDERAERKGL